MAKLNPRDLSEDLGRLVKRARYLFINDQGEKYSWQPNPNGGRTLKLPGVNALHDFYKEMERRPGEGKIDGALAFLSAVEEFEVERQAVARVLILLACKLRDNNYPRVPIRESMVADFGTFAKVLIKEKPEMVVNWVVDMNIDDPEFGLTKQPTEVIRGVLMACDHRAAVNFWELAASEPNFPDRIFADPCPYDEGQGFSSWHVRNFGTFFSHASNEAFERFSRYMASHARTKQMLIDLPDDRSDADKRQGLPERFQTKVVRVPLTEGEREIMLANIADSVRDRERRARLHLNFGLPPLA